MSLNRKSLVLLANKNERFLSHASKNFASSDVYGNAIIIRENGDMNDESIKEVGHLLRNGYRYGS
ncbi:8189_t:CDS:2 [Entrophospora sp. SA101]|nr:8189_t:CDS:2 [Entrophospora sp. SA101]